MTRESTNILRQHNKFIIFFLYSIYIQCYAILYYMFKLTDNSKLTLGFCYAFKVLMGTFAKGAKSLKALCTIFIMYKGNHTIIHKIIRLFTRALPVKATIVRK